MFILRYSHFNDSFYLSQCIHACMTTEKEESRLMQLKDCWADFQNFVVDVVYDRRRDAKARVFGFFLVGFSWIFSVIAQLRYWAYRNRIFRDQPLGCLVVVVGNLTVGGTGKTPVVEKFARSLRDRGRTVAILSRGYKSKKEPLYRRFWRWITHKEAPPPRIVSDGKNVLLNSEVAGDEPYMLARNLPGVIVLTDKNRVKAGEYAIKQFGADTLLLDDGFQYMPLRGRLNLLLIDKTNPFGNHHLLPRGILREPIKHLRRASYIFLTKSDGTPDPDLERLIRHYKPDADFIECAHRPRYLRSVDEKERFELDWLKDKKVAALSGIAMPESFENLLRESGATIVLSQRFLDHHRFTDEELERFFDTALSAQVEALITTEKDAVRIQKTNTFPLPFLYLRMEIDILYGVSDFEEAVSRICFPKREMRTTQKEMF